MGGAALMKYYKHTVTGEVFAYESEQERQEWGAPELVEMTPEEVDAHLNPPPGPQHVPQQVTRRQGRLALLEVGKLDDVEAAIEAIDDPIQKRAAQIEYEADTWERSNAFLQSMWAQLGGTPEQLDDLFALAASK